ncbi:MAG: hypothetical protein AAF108_01810 [Planctomycetota bacterium]
MWYVSVSHLTRSTCSTSPTSAPHRRSRSTPRTRATPTYRAPYATPPSTSTPDSLIDDPDELVFWDLVYPAVQAHQILGDAVYESIIPTPGSASIATLALDAARRRR